MPSLRGAREMVLLNGFQLTLLRKRLFFLHGIDFLSKSFDSGVKIKWSLCFLKLVLARGSFIFSHIKSTPWSWGWGSVRRAPVQHAPRSRLHPNAHINQALRRHIPTILACGRERQEGRIQGHSPLHRVGNQSGLLRLCVRI